MFSVDFSEAAEASQLNLLAKFTHAFDEQCVI